MVEWTLSRWTPYEAGCPLPFRPDHGLRPHPPVEVLGREQAKRHSGFFERRAFLMSLLSHLGGIVIADMRIQRGDQHQAVLQIGGDARAFRIDTNHTMFAEA